MISLSMQRVQLSPKVYFAMASTLQSTTCHMNIVFEISMEKYLLIVPSLQRICQGKGTGSIIWVMISAILLTIMRDKGWT